MHDTRLPELHGRTLSDRPLRLPDDLPEAPVVLVMGLTHEARHDVGAWKAALDAAGVPWLSVAVAPTDLPPEAMEPIAAAMRRAVPQPAWDRIVQVHAGGAALCAALGWSPDAHAKVLRTDRSGRLLGRHDHGPFSPEALGALMA